MGAGESPFGTGPFGFDPVVSSDPRSTARAPQAQQFDGASRDFPIDSAGNFLPSHPVDQAVALSVLTRRGSIRSAPLVGNNVHEIANTASPRLEEQIRTRIDDAFPLRDLVAEGFVQIVKIEHDASIPGRLLVAVTYRNLKLGANATDQTVRTASNG